jgi:hypothetical protein
MLMNVIDVIVVGFLLLGRISPIIFVSFFLFTSVINGDFQGLFLLIGLLITFVLSKMIGDIGTIFVNNTLTGRTHRCNLLAIGSNGPYSNIPLGITTITYILFYLIYPIIKYSIVGPRRNLDQLLSGDLNNWRITFLSFCILINMVWLVIYKCANPFAIVAGMAIAICVALGYAYILDHFTTQKLYLAGATTPVEKCYMHGTTMTCTTIL